MRSIKQLCPTMGDAIQAMVDGLLEQDAREDFKVNMDTFGDTDESTSMCFGCAATCAIQKIAKRNLNLRNIKLGGVDRASELDISYHEADSFETAIDAARLGRLVPIWRFYYSKLYPDFSFSLPPLRNDSWRMHIHAYMELARKLKAKGI